MNAAVNAHTHVYSGLAPLGMPLVSPAPTSFVEILERVWWRLDRALDEDSLCASAEFYVAEALALGTVGLIDHHESPNFVDGSLDVIAEVCQRLGMPAVLAYGATERNQGRGEASRGLAECRRFIENNSRPLVRGAIGLHASFTVSDDTLRDAGELARALAVVLHVHVAEDVADVEHARAAGYQGVIDRLEKCDALVPGSVFAHGVHLTEDEVRRVDDAGIWLVQNPRSNCKNGVGLPRSLDQSKHVALGTDGYPADMAAEAGALANDIDASARIAGSRELLKTFFNGELPAASPTPGDAERESIRVRAQEQAARLWQRMKAS